jgi:hypothetical protein
VNLCSPRVPSFINDSCWLWHSKLLTFKNLLFYFSEVSYHLSDRSDATCSNNKWIGLNSYLWSFKRLLVTDSTYFSYFPPKCTLLDSMILWIMSFSYDRP